jgi:hypothetical protein
MNTAIYYPHFYPSDTWLRLAALCWDRIYTMQLENTAPAPEPLLQLDNALGGVLDVVHPWEDFGKISGVTHQPISAEQKDMLESLGYLIKDDGKLVERPATLQEIASWEETARQFSAWLDLRAERLRGRLAPSSGQMEKLVAMPSWKVDSKGGSIYKVLSERQLLRVESREEDVQIAYWEKDEWEWEQSGVEAAPLPPRKPEPGSDHEKYVQLERAARQAAWTGNQGTAQRLREEAQRIRQQHLITVSESYQVYYMPEDVALHYLSLCASKAAQAAKRDVVTDRRNFIDAIVNSVPELHGQVAEAVLSTYVPKDLSRLDPVRIADCRAALSIERLKYQQEIQSLVDQFSNVVSEDSYTTLRQELIEIAHERISGTKKAYRASRLDLATKTLSISLTPPAVATAAASALDIGAIAPAGLGVLLSLFAVGTFIQWSGARAERRQEPWTYVLAVSKHLR